MRKSNGLRRFELVLSGTQRLALRAIPHLYVGPVGLPRRGSNRGDFIENNALAGVDMAVGKRGARFRRHGFVEQAQVRRERIFRKPLQAGLELAVQGS